MIVYDVPQGTQRWLDLRAGLPTTSNFDRIVKSGGKKGIPGTSEQSAKYMNHLLAERIAGRPIDYGFKSSYMERGSDLEDSAVAAYEIDHVCETERIGFVTDDSGTVGCSPDRWILNQPRGMFESKAPSAAVHVGYLMAATGAECEYKIQLMGQLWICEKDWVDICSFHPDLPLAVFRFNRDEAFIKELAARVRAFCCELEEKAALLTERGWIRPKVEPLAEDFGSLGITDEDLRWMTPGVHYTPTALDQAPSITGFPDEAL